MNSIRNINQVDRINRLYKDHNGACEPNIIPFKLPPNGNISGLLDDVEALLSDPNTRELTESTLRLALQHIAAHYVQKK